METSKIEFNYFYKMFKGHCRKTIFENNTNDNGHNNHFTYSGECQISNKEKILIYNKALYNICLVYLNLSNSPITILPNNALELLNLIFETTTENPYEESFLLSLQFIYQNYFECLEMGNPILMSSNNETLEPVLNVVLDSNNELLEFDSVNLDLVEQDEIMTQLLYMQMNGQQGPIPKVLYKIRKDV